MATFTVTTGQDVVDPNDGVLSLREAVAQANATTAADTIGFAAALDAQPLVLTGGELALARDVTLDGDRDGDGARVTLSGGDATRLVRITGGGTDVVLQDIALSDGRAPSFSPEGDGGAVHLGGGSLTLRGSSITHSYAHGGAGGGIAAAAGTRLSVIDSSIVDNHAIVEGGGIGAFGAIDLVVRGSVIAGNSSSEATGGGIASSGRLVIEGSTLSGNYAYAGGALAVRDSTATIARTAILDNTVGYAAGGGIFANNARVLLTESTVAGNAAPTETNFFPSAYGGGIRSAGGALVVRNSTVTGNSAGSETYGSGSSGGGIWASGALDVANSIVAGNSALGPNPSGPDVEGSLTLSNGHNLFGSDVLGNIAGDRENVAASALFAALDPETGGGLVGPAGIAALRANAANPAISGGDPLAANSTGQGGFNPRPSPASSLPDIGAAESAFAPSTAASPNNDVLTGTSGANTLSALAGNDLVRGLGGADTLGGGGGSDLLDGGTGNDRLNGGAAVDLVTYASGSGAVTVDLRGETAGDTDTATRGTETDTLTGIEGAVGGAGADRFFGDGANNYFQGGAGRDTFTGGAGRDLYDLDLVAHSGPGGTARDVVADFAVGTDDLDLAGIDANTGVAGDQAFRFVGTAGLGTAPGAVGYFTSGGNTIVRASNDTDGTAELEIQLAGLKALTVDDFYL